MKKVLFVYSKLSSGGSERVMTLLANEFARQKYHTTMALLREDENETYKVDDQVNLIRFSYGTKNKLRIAIKRFHELRKLLKENKYDAVISFMYDINILTIFAASGLKQHIIVSERNDPSRRLGNGLFKAIECLAYSRAAYVVFQTDEVKKYYTDAVQRIGVTIPNPVNGNLPERFNGEREKMIMAVGRLTEQKNFELLLNGFAKFHQRHKDYCLTICGQGSLLDRLKEQAKRLEIEQNVLFVGYVSDVNTRMQKSAMYVSTSNYEGISNAMLEALAMGVPCICTDCPVGGARLMIQNMVNGLLIPVGDEASLVKAMNMVADDSELAEKLGVEGEKIRKEYSIEKIAEQWKRLLERD